MEIYWEPPCMKEALMSYHVYFYLPRECSESEPPKNMETSASPNHPLFIHLFWVFLGYIMIQTMAFIDLAHDQNK